MRRLLMVLMIAAFAIPAFADQNPFIRLYVDFEPPVGVHRVDDPVGPFTAYLVLDCFGGDGGIRAVSLLIERTFGGYNVGSANLLGGQALGGPEDPAGWALTAFDCVMPDQNGMVLAASVDYLYTGPAGYIKILGHPVDGKMTVDCDFLVDMYCVYMNGGVNADPPEGDPDCDCPPSPVEDSSWGTIKALYR